MNAQRLGTVVRRHCGGDELEILLAVVAVVSLVINYLQFQRSRDRDRIRLKVVPVQIFGTGGLRGYDSVGIQVTNLSSFPVVVSEVGFELRDSDSRWALLDPKPMSNVKYPCELASRRSATFNFPHNAHRNPKMATVTRAYARTECGNTVTGISGALKSLVAQAREETGEE